MEFKISHILSSDNSNVKLNGTSDSVYERDPIDNSENLDKDTLIPLQSKVDFIICNKSPKENIYFSTNKTSLEKLIADLEKVQGMMVKYKTG